MKNIRLSYGIRDDTLLHVSQVDSGKACACICPVCHSPLIAQKRKTGRQYFSHRNKPTACQHAAETALYLAVKDVLERSSVIQLPPVIVKFTSYRPPIELAPSINYKIESVRMEYTDQSHAPAIVTRINDCDVIIKLIGMTPGDGQDNERIRELGLSAVGIDLNGAQDDFSIDALTGLVVHGHGNKQWLYNAWAQSEYDRLISESRPKNVIHRGLALHVDDCPIQVRTWQGKSYANVIDDCLYCNNCLAWGDNRSRIHCIGHNADLLNVPHNGIIK